MLNKQKTEKKEKKRKNTTIRSLDSQIQAKKQNNLIV